MRKITKLVLLVLVAVISVTFITACSSKDGVSEAPSDAPSNYSESGSDTNAILPEGVTRKIVYNVNMDLTVADMEVAGNELEDKVYELGGWVDKSVENSRNSYNNNYYILKVPSVKLKEFLDTVEGLGEVTSKHTESTDITTLYVSATAKKQALESERDALNALNLTDLGEIMERSRRITQINTELNALQLEINGYDSITEYSSVKINLYSVDAPKGAEDTYANKLNRIFKGSVKSLGLVFIGFVAVLPYLAVLGAITGAIFLIRFLIKKFRNKKKNEENKKSE